MADKRKLTDLEAAAVFEKVESNIKRDFPIQLPLPVKAKLEDIEILKITGVNFEAGSFSMDKSKEAEIALLTQNYVQAEGKKNEQLRASGLYMGAREPIGDIQYLAAADMASRIADAQGPGLSPSERAKKVQQELQNIAGTEQKPDSHLQIDAANTVLVYKLERHYQERGLAQALDRQQEKARHRQQTASDMPARILTSDETIAVMSTATKMLNIRQKNGEDVSDTLKEIGRNVQEITGIRPEPGKPLRVDVSHEPQVDNTAREFYRETVMKRVPSAPLILKDASHGVPRRLADETSPSAAQRS